jgi:hypothetical protein
MAPGRRWALPLRALILTCIFAAIVYFSAQSLLEHGRGAINAGFLISAVIAAGCAWKVARDSWSWLHTIGEFSYDDGTLSVQTLGRRAEQVFDLSDIARVEFHPHDAKIVLSSGARLHITHDLANGSELAEKLQLDLVPVQADPVLSLVRELERGYEIMSADAARFRDRMETLAVSICCVSALLFVAGFYFGGQKQKLSGVHGGYFTEQRGDGYYAIKHRGGPNPPTYEITEQQHRIWQEGHSIHAAFHISAVLVFFVGWCIGFCVQRRPRR